MSDTEGCVEPKRKRGQPRNIDPSTVIAILEKNKDRLCTDGSGRCIVSKLDEVWTEMAAQLNYSKSAESLYTHVTCNKDNVRQKLWEDFIQKHALIDDSDVSIAESLVERSSLDSTVQDESRFDFAIHVAASDFDKLVETRTYTGKKKQLHAVKKFLKGEWQQFITAKIWANTRLKCGYNFKYHYLNNEVTPGHFIGKCTCGSNIDCNVERHENIITILCSTTKGTRECGKRFVRGTVRVALGKELQSKSAHAFRAELANDLMRDGDCEPPHLPKTSTMRQIRYEVAAAKLLNPDLMKALEILSLYNMKEEIPWIGYKPFFIHYSTKHQRTVYTAICEKENVCLAIDASGSLIQPITRIDKKKSGPIFLYVAVVSTPSGQVSVAQMLTERHTTGAIHFWLNQWTEQWGLAPPKEIVCDMPRSLLGGAIRAYTRNTTINNYADEFLNGGLPACYIRIDIAHYINMRVKILAGSRREVGKFYKSCIGKLILCRNIDDAQRLVSAVLTIARSDNCGQTDVGLLSACEREKAYMKQVLTTADLRDLNLDDYDNCSINEDEEVEEEPATNAAPSLWRNWAQRIDKSVQTEIEKYQGTEINPHWLPSFADRLVEELKWLPLWSCIFRDRYGYGRCPASSTHVEAEFGTIKNQVFRHVTPPLRADDFIQRHKTYIDGTSKIINAGTARRNSIDDLNEDSATCSSHAQTEEAEIPQHTRNTNMNTFASSSLKISSSMPGEIPQQCPACKNGDVPGGAHRCMICKQAVHAIEPCSVPADNSEEGFGQKRICVSCSAKPNAPELIESRAEENWRNQVIAYEKKQTRGRYLQATYPENEFLLTDAAAVVPILKSGAEAKLKPIRIGGQKHDLIRTCSFDALFQLFLTATFDSPCLVEDMH